MRDVLAHRFAARHEQPVAGDRVDHASSLRRHLAEIVAGGLDRHHPGAAGGIEFIRQALRVEIVVAARHACLCISIIYMICD
ncbi:MAG: hypothetical protein OXL98_10695 [Acidimicrobiaceae bacterium]|nr:hypothetical protein [Acidimicrobiaceae bacterium]